MRRANATVPTRLLVKSAPDPGAEICRTAAAESADLVVMATHARHHVAQRLVGGTTQQVITNSPAPVLAIRYGIAKRAALKKIVVPLQPPATASSALDLAAAIVSREHGEIHLLTICKPAGCAAAEDQLAQVVANKLRGLSSTRTVVTGEDVEREVTRYTDRSGADAVFLRSAGKPSPLRLDILRHASVPVMIVPG